MDCITSTEKFEKELEQLSADSVCSVGKNKKPLIQTLVEKNYHEHIRLYTTKFGISSYQWLSAPKNCSTLHLAASKGNLETFKVVFDLLGEEISTKVFELAGSNDQSVLNLIVKSEDHQEAAAQKIDHLFKSDRCDGRVRIWKKSIDRLH